MLSAVLGMAAVPTHSEQQYLHKAHQQSIMGTRGTYSTPSLPEDLLMAKGYWRARACHGFSSAICAQLSLLE